MTCGLNALALMYKYIYFPINIHVAVSCYFVISNKWIKDIFVRRYDLYRCFRGLYPYVYLLTITSIKLFTFIVNRFNLNLVLITLCVIILNIKTYLKEVKFMGWTLKDIEKRIVYFKGKLKQERNLFKRN